MSKTGASLNVESVTGHAVIRLQHDVSAAYEPQQALLDQASTEQIFLPSTSLGSSQVQLQRIDQLMCRLGSTQPPRLRFAGKDGVQRVAGGEGTSCAVCNTPSTPLSSVLPVSVAAPVSWVATGGEGPCRRWHPPVPFSPPVVLVAAPTTLPALLLTAFWTCSRGTLLSAHA